MPTPHATNIIAAAIRQRRRDCRMAQDDLGRAVGLRSGSYISHVERGVKIPTYEFVTRLARALGLEGAESFAGYGRDSDTAKSDRRAERPALTLLHQQPTTPRRSTRE